MENKKVKGSFNDLFISCLAENYWIASETLRLNVENTKVKGSFNDYFHIMLSLELLDSF